MLTRIISGVRDVMDRVPWPGEKEVVLGEVVLENESGDGAA